MHIIAGADGVVMAGNLFRIFTCGIVFGCSPVVLAGENDRYDKRIERAAAKRAAERLGELRGTLTPDAQAPIGATQVRKPIRPGFPILEEKKDDGNRLPPVVLNRNTAAPDGHHRLALSGS